MKNLRTSRNLCIVVISCIAMFALAALSSARSMTTSVNIANNSNREIRNVYLSHVDADDWGANQLGNTTIPAGQSMNLNVACDQQQVKVIAEDSEGCFISTVLTCGSSTTWTITNNSARDCGN